MRADNEYVAARDAYIPQAEAAADRAAGKTPKLLGMSQKEADKEKKRWAARWNRIFFGEMDALNRDTTQGSTLKRLAALRARVEWLLAERRKAMGRGWN